MKIIITESQYNRILKEEEEQKVLEKTIQNLLGKLVSPKYNAKITYEISFEKHNDTNVEYVMVDVYIDRDDYLRDVKTRYTSDEIQYEIKEALKYLGITKSHVEVWAF
jgi:uncharacterized membrane protein YheB (UPF0754 family)